MKKNIFLLILVVSVNLLIYGNGTNEKSTSIPPIDMSKNYEITIGTWGQDVADAYNEALMKSDFTGKFPNIKVKFMVSDFSSHHTRAITTIAAGEATNEIEMLEVAQIAKFIEGGGLQPLDVEPFNGFDAGSELVEFAMVNASSKNGRLVAYPVDIAPAVLFYRKSLVDAAGVSLENLQSWDEFINIGMKLTKDLDGDGVIDQYAIPHAVEVSSVPLNGGMSGWFTKDGVPLEPKSKFMEALNLVKAVRDAGIDADLGTWSPPWLQSFGDGTIVATINGAWFGGALETYIAPETKGDWRVTYIPNNSAASMGGSYMSIPIAVPNDKKAAAWEVIKYLCTSEAAQLNSFRKLSSFPVLTTLYDNPVMDEKVEFFGGQKVRQIYSQVASKMPADPVSEYDPIARAIFGNYTTMVLVDDMPTTEAYSSALSEIIAVAD
ncbi:MAG: extracellular solute-binding protein [Spirochaetales bacterium]|nr:extracellular solute-binding protein [Spirochaetales bacterium]